MERFRVVLDRIARPQTQRHARICASSERDGRVGDHSFSSARGIAVPPDYQRLATADDPALEKQVLDWPANSDYGFAQLRAQGDANRGLQLIHSYGCNSCHTIPGLAPPGRVGPPLTKFAERQYIAGWLVNVPSNAVNWIENPKQFKPQTVMPNLHVQPVEALHITAYLYTSGRSDRLRALERLVRMGKISTVNGD